MSKKCKIAFGAIAAVVAVAAVVAGFCFVFLGNRKIVSAPSTLEVRQFDGKHYLLTEYNGKYSYQFKIEQQIDGDYLLIKQVNTNTNSVCLEDYDINLDADKTFRFSARYINENGGGGGQFCDYLLWSPTQSVESVEADSFVFENDCLSWDAVMGASKYNVVVVSEDLTESKISCDKPSCSLSEFAVGKYNVFVTAVSSSGESAHVSVGTSVVISRQNQITNAKLSNGKALSFDCSQAFRKLEVYSGQTLLGTINFVDGKAGSFTYSDCEFLFVDVDLTTADVLQSELVTVEKQ
jgi:hypothetical protein